MIEEMYRDMNGRKALREEGGGRSKEQYSEIVKVSAAEI